MFELHKPIPTEQLLWLRKIDNRWDYLLEYFPDFKYWEPAAKYKDKIAITVKDNILGHTQRTFVTYWAMRTFLEFGGEPGISMCAGQVRDAFTISNDLYYTDKHPVYGGEYKPQIVGSCDDLPFIGTATIPFVVSNHGLEHTEDPGKTLREWMRILKSGGVIAAVVPDEKFQWAERDPSHKHKYSAEDILYNFIEPITNEGLAELLEFDTFNNYFSFPIVMRKK